ncbi:hypothetical protein NDU88_004091 [Pleurodeles waltl]|uniref:Uncharacterized protein n=1 Tax=Pleurodeles waltl TaxID=8319 RepID=A0AAV7WUM4_PLEWA|nr:hypothetical protein NDU88_004091 [Pleurodeles waltl]
MGANREGGPQRRGTVSACGSSPSPLLSYIVQRRLPHFIRPPSVGRCALAAGVVAQGRVCAAAGCRALLPCAGLPPREIKRGRNVGVAAEKLRCKRKQAEPVGAHPGLAVTSM